jgi:Mg-chelatase subunit ChlD
MSRTSVLAKLLATENIDVVYKGTRTAAFDVVNRVLYMPIWKEIGKDLEDLLTGHEVGHALYTPSEGWHESDKSYDFPRSYINIIEDIRIERLVQAKYPGLKGSFKRGYMELIERDFFGTADRPMESLGFMDRLNIKAKARDLMDVPFTAEELDYVKIATSPTTFEEVLEACATIYEWLKEKKKDECCNPGEAPSVQESGDDDDFTPSSGDTEVEVESNDESQDESSKAESNSKQDEGSENKSEDFGKDTAPADNNDEVKEESKSEPIKSAGQDGNIDEVMTDNAFREKEEELLETNGRGDLPTVTIGISKETIKNVLVPAKEAVAMRREHVSSVIATDRYVANQYEEAVNEFNNFMDESKKTVNTMAKEFEMRKAAFQHARAKTSKSGSLDVTKLHSYKFNDDLFLRSTTLADAKNHGLVAVIDFSGSMQDVLRNVIDQAIVLAMFCRKVGIPFEIYSFTTNSWKNQHENLNQKDGEINCSSLNLVQQLSSTMNKTDFTAAAQSLYVAYSRDRWSMPFMSDIDALGGTPLNETLIIMNELIKEFKGKNAVQKINLVTITDGEGGWLDVVGNGSYGYNDIILRMNNKNVKIKRHSRSAGTKEILECMRKSGINIVGYFIINNLRDIRHRFYNEYSEIRKELRDKKVAQVGAIGYDTYFVLDGRQDAIDDEFDVKDNAKKGDIARAFKKFAKSKKGNRAMAVQFAQAVA